MQRRRVGLQQLGGQVRAWLGEQADIPRLGRCSLRLPQYDLVLAPCFGADGGAASERHCLRKAFFVLPSDRYMALWARQSCRHSLLLLLAASATPPKTAILKPAITQKRTIDDSCSFMAEPLLSRLTPFPSSLECVGRPFRSDCSPSQACFMPSLHPDADSRPFNKEE